MNEHQTWTVDVTVADHDALQAGIVETGWVRCEVVAKSETEAQLVACQIAARSGVPTSSIVCI